MKPAVTADQSPRPRPVDAGCSAWPRRALASLACVLLLGACGKPDHRALLASAVQRLEQDDAATAAIEARNVLKSAPDSGAARFVLGRALLVGGDLAGAGVELDRALSFGHPEAEVLPVQAQLLRAHRKPQDVVDRFKDKRLADPAGHAALRVQLSAAYRELGDAAAAMASVDEALAVVPGHLEASVAKAKILAATGDTEGAVSMADALRQRAPGDPQVGLLHADLLVHRGADKAAAAEAFRGLLSKHPNLIQAHAGLINLLLEQGDLPAARAQAEALARARPGTPIADFHLALTAFAAGDFRQVRELTQRLLRGSLDDARVLYLAGMAELQLGALVQAESLLANALLAMPDAVEPRRELAGLYVRRARPTAALETLKPLLSAGTQDSGAWRYAGQAHALAGDFARADEAFAQAARLQPGDARVRVAAGKSLIARGQGEAGLRMLREAAAADSIGIEADLELISVLVQRRDHAGALKAVDALAAKRPDAPMPEQLRGRVLQQAGDLAGARAAFDRALQRDPVFSPALTSLARLDLLEGRVDAARQRYEALVKRDPRASEAMLALAALMLRAGGSFADASTWVDKAVQARPTDAEIWRLAIIVQRDAGDMAGALSRARAAVSAMPDQLPVLAVAAEVQIAGGDVQQAVATAQRMLQLRPGAPDVLVKLSEAYLAAGNRVTARQHARRAMALAPDWTPALRQAALVEMRDEQVQAALALARAAQARRPDASAGWQIEGEIAAAQGNWRDAAAAFRQALGKGEQPLLAGQLHGSLMRSDQRAEAARLEQRWFKAYPEDMAFRVLLAQDATERSDWTASVAHYRVALDGEPDNVVLLNNLAYAQVQARDPQALATAQRAAQVAPASAPVLDTLALAFAQAGNVPRAIAAQARAVELDARNGAYRLQLARLYLRVGDKKKAREEVQRLQQLGPERVPPEELRALQREMQG